ncbi:MAG: RNase P modulator RnpM [Desulfuromonadales bacterium]
MTQVRRQPQRTCLGCRQVKDQSELIRVVRSPDGEILADLKGRLPGRGAYLCNKRDCIESIVRKKQFDRAFRQACLAITAGQLCEAIAQELLTHLASLLGMARKSANFVAGSNAVLDTLTRKKKLAVVILAKDISPKIGEKIRYKAEQQKILTTELFDKTELGRILGRAERSVVGLPDGKLAEAFLNDLHRYQEISGES